MANLNNPSPQWAEPVVSAHPPSRLLPLPSHAFSPASFLLCEDGTRVVTDPTGGGIVLDFDHYWIFLPAGAVPSGAVVRNSGWTVIDDSQTVGLKPTKTPSGALIFY